MLVAHEERVGQREPAQAPAVQVVVERERFGLEHPQAVALGVGASDMQPGRGGRTFAAHAAVAGGKQHQ